MSVLTKFLARYAKAVAAAIGAAAIILPFVLGATGDWVKYFQAGVSILTVLGVYQAPYMGATPKPLTPVSGTKPGPTPQPTAPVPATPPAPAAPFVPPAA